MPNRYSFRLCAAPALWLSCMQRLRQPFYPVRQRWRLADSLPKHLGVTEAQPVTPPCLWTPGAVPTRGRRRFADPGPPALAILITFRLQGRAAPTRAGTGPTGKARPHYSSPELMLSRNAGSLQRNRDSQIRQPPSSRAPHCYWVLCREAASNIPLSFCPLTDRLLQTHLPEPPDISARC